MKGCHLFLPLPRPQQTTQVTPVGGTPSGPGDRFMEVATNGNDDRNLNPMVASRMIRPPPIDTSFNWRNIPIREPSIGSVVTNRVPGTYRTPTLTGSSPTSLTNTSTTISGGTNYLTPSSFRSSIGNRIYPTLPSPLSG